MNERDVGAAGGSEGDEGTGRTEKKGTQASQGHMLFSHQ